MDARTTNASGATAQSQCGKLIPAFMRKLIMTKAQFTIFTQFSNLYVQTSNRSVFRYAMIPGCGLGQHMLGDQCMDCGLGTYQDENFHTDTTCKSCAGTKIFSVVSING